MDSQKRIPLEKAQKLAKTISEQYHLKNHTDWLLFTKEIIAPKKGKSFLSFEKAREFARKLKLKDLREWIIYCDENHHILFNIPSHPPKYYKNKWISWGDFLSAKHYVLSKFLSFEDAKCFVQNIKPKIINCKEWDAYCKSGKKPKNIPHSPQKIYKNTGWTGWNYFLGIGLYRPDVEEGKILSDEELLDDMEFDINNLGGLVEVFREESNTDEEILEKYKDEPPVFLEALRQHLNDCPRDDKENE